MLALAVPHIFLYKFFSTKLITDCIREFFQCTLAAVSLFPSRAYVVKVSMEMITGVVAQKYTHQASRYFLPFKLFNSAALRKNAKL